MLRFGKLCLHFALIVANLSQLLPVPVSSFVYVHSTSRRPPFGSSLYFSGTPEGNREDVRLDELNGTNGRFEGSFDPGALSPDRSLRPSKGDLYSDLELQKILDIHTDLAGDFAEATSQKTNEPTPALHDMVLQTLSQLDESPDASQASEVVPEKPKLADQLKEVLPRIAAIASDVDGTLLSSKHVIHPRTQQAVEKAVEAMFSPLHPLKSFFPATGKSRAGALESLGPTIKSLLSQVPGVFCQGLYCVDARGNVVYEKKICSTEAIEQVEQLADKYRVSMIAYDGDTLVANANSNPDHTTEVSVRYGEPCPIVRDAPMAEYAPGFHKILLMDNDLDKLNARIRPQLEALAREFDCTVTQAIPNMLEVLPLGTSKALGVRKLCEALGIDPSTQLLAIGDAENDIGMLEMAAVGIAVGNAAPMVKEKADIVIDETNDEGGAGAVIELFGTTTLE